MVQTKKEPFYHEENNELLGIVTCDNTSWLAQTIFGYTISRTSSRQEAEDTLLKSGLSSLRGTWQYFDEDEKDWFPCVIQEAYENKVIVNRTNEYGMQDSSTYKHVVLMNPTEENLTKSS